MPGAPSFSRPMIEFIVPACWVLWGLCLGSFINVVIHRLPREKPIAWAVSHCPRCRKPIAFYDNVPLLSYLLLLGRCRHCRKPISWRYPLVEALMGALSIGLWWRWQGDPLWIFLATCAAGALVAIAFIDWDTMLIPNTLSLGLLAVGLGVSAWNPLLPGDWLHRAGYSLLGGAAGFVICYAVAAFGEFVFKKEAMGGGDIKLLAAVGAWSGALGAFDCLLVGSFAGALFGAALLLRRRVRRQDPIAFGPFLSLAAILNFFYILPFGFPFH